MQATAVRDFTATFGGSKFDCKQGDVVSGDAKTIAQLEAIGLVTTKQEGRAKSKPGKAEKDD